MSSNHQRNVRGMHAAPRCEVDAQNGDPCKNPAVRGKKRCHVHGGRGAKGKHYRRESNDFKAAYLELEHQVHAPLRKLDKAIRKRERAGETVEQLADLHAIRREFNFLTKHKPTDLAALYRPPEAEVIARMDRAAVLEARLKYASFGHHSLDMVRDRARGAMLGLAVGEAVGVTLAGWPRDSYRPIKDMLGGGRLGLKSGEWAGDTAMALALMESLTYRRVFDETDFMERLIEWREGGVNSCTGSCVGMGDTTQEALERYERTADPIAGEVHGDCVSNGSLARMAPVAIRYWNQHADLRNVAVRQSRTTHGGPSALQACAGFADILADAIAGQPHEDVLRSRAVYDPLSDRPVGLGRWEDKKRDQVWSGNNALMSLEAALWCVGKMESFEEAVLRAANLGEDAGSTAAVTGQLAGALYGACAIPTRWLEQLAWHDQIIDRTDALFDLGRTRHSKARQ